MLQNIFFVTSLFLTLQNKGWWTYEVCFGKGIYQYHEEGTCICNAFTTLGGVVLKQLFLLFLTYLCLFLFRLPANEIVGDKISLGVFSNETDWSQEKIEKVRIRENIFVVVQFYSWLRLYFPLLQTNSMINHKSQLIQVYRTGKLKEK